MFSSNAGDVASNITRDIEDRFESLKTSHEIQKVKSLVYFLEYFLSQYVFTLQSF